MNIGCDLDGVIVDHSYNEVMMLAERGIHIVRENITKKILKQLLAMEQYYQFKQELYNTRAGTADEIEGAFNALQKIVLLGNTVHIISRRNQSGKQALQWLDAHGFFSFIPQDHIHFVSAYNDKEGVCRRYNIDLHIDDSPEVFDVLFTPRHRILFDPLSRHRDQKNVLFAQSWDDIPDIIAHAQIKAT